MSHLMAPTSVQHPFIPTLPSGDIQHSEHPLISNSALTPIRTSLPDNYPRVLHPKISSSQADTNFHSYSVHLDRSTSMSTPVHQGATLPPQAQAAFSAASYSLLPPSDPIHNLPSSSRRVTSSDAPHTCYTPPDAHYHTRPSRDYQGLQHQHKLSLNVPPSLRFIGTSIPESSLLNSPFGCGAFLPRIPLSQTNTIVCTQNPCSFNVDPARSIHQNTTATLYPQAQVSRFAAYRPWQPPNNYSQTSPSSLLRVTSDSHHVLQPFGCYMQHPQPPTMLIPPPSVFLSSHPHNFVEQNLSTSQARFAGFESAHHGQLYPSSNRTAAYDLQGASFTPFHPPSTVSGVSHPMPHTTPSGSFRMFPPARSDCRNPNLPFHDVTSREIRNISAPTLLGASRSSTPCVRSHDTSSESRHPTMQPPEAERRRTAGEILVELALFWDESVSYLIKSF